MIHASHFVITRCKIIRRFQTHLNTNSYFVMILILNGTRKRRIIHFRGLYSYRIIINEALPPHNRRSMCRHWLEQHRSPRTNQCLKLVQFTVFPKYLNLSAALRAASAPSQSAASIFIL